MQFDYHPPNGNVPGKNREKRSRLSICFAVIIVVALILPFIFSDATPNIEARTQPEKTVPEIRREFIEGSIESGDSISLLLDEYLTLQEIDSLNRKSRSVFPLSRICTGQPYKICLTEGEFDRFEYDINRDEQLIIVRGSEDFDISRQPIDYTIETELVRGTIETSLFDAVTNAGEEAELAMNIGTLTSTQPAGIYYILVQPEAGSGSYELMIRQTDSGTGPGSEDPSVSTEVPSDSITVGETTTVTVNLNNVPPEGYTSAEFVCTYPPTLVEVSNIVVTSLFGVDPATAILGPQGGSFIFAIAGSNGQRATTSGAVFTFDVTALATGQAVIECNVRVSTGNDVLIDLPSFSTTLTISEDGTLDGQVFATKPVTVSLYNPDTTLAASVQADLDGTFSLTAPAGNYTVVATASGFLNAEGPAVIIAGQTTTKTTISLLAGDIDGNGVIDQYDAMTIGMSYNTASPDAADLNADGTINVLDLEILAANYRATGPQNWP